VSDDAGIDADALPRLAQMVGDDVLREVLDLYFDHVPHRLAALRDGLGAGELDGAARALHDLKSSAGMVGASGVSRLADEMERLARGGDREAVRERVERLESAVEAAGQVLREARRKWDT
jgi:HPt (histidine-containing phosphotransfer) domain-containing protein